MPRIKTRASTSLQEQLLLLLIIALTTLFLAACEGKKSLDGYPMDKPPPSAYGPRDSEPSLDKADDK